jgi:hypothetical protein
MGEKEKSKNLIELEAVPLGNFYLSGNGFYIVN